MDESHDGHASSPMLVGLPEPAPEEIQQPDPNPAATPEVVIGPTGRPWPDLPDPPPLYSHGRPVGPIITSGAGAGVGPCPSISSAAGSETSTSVGDDA